MVPVSAKRTTDLKTHHFNYFLHLAGTGRHLITDVLWEL